jgi:HAMP domain-containing protein
MIGPRHSRSFSSCKVVVRIAAPALMSERPARKLAATWIILLISCVFVVLEFLLWRQRELLGNAFWGIQVAAGALMLGVTSLHRLATRTDSAVESARASSALLAEAARGDTPADELGEVKAELTRMAEQIEVRDRELTERLKTFHEWMEFPQPVNLSDDEEISESTTEVAAQDKELLALLEKESQRVFDRVLANEYSVGGQVQFPLIRDEATELVRRIAQIYQPESVEPLLETSVAQILHAASRSSLQFLVVLEQLPLDVKEYSLQRIYEYVRKGVQAYGVYKKFEPYKPYVDTAYYLGRFAMGASPVTLGAWFMLGTLGQRGAQALTTNLLERQALTFLHNLIRVIGYEVAGIYGGDFRHRDPNWYYAIEVVELIQIFPASRESLRRGLKEIGRLTLRSEYDRIFLYRCLASHQSAAPDQYDSSVLPAAERSQIAQRLELIFHEDIHGRTEELVNGWKAGLEQRLNVKLKLDSRQAAERSEQESILQAARSLASFLVDTRQCDPTRLVDLLTPTKTLSAMDPVERSQWLVATQHDPPFYFEPPDLDPKSPATTQFLQDLTALAVEVPPYLPNTRHLIEEVAHFLRQDTKLVLTTHDDALIERLSRTLVVSHPEAQLNADAATALTATLESTEKLRLAYRDVKIKPSRSDVTDELLFYATDEYCAVLSMGASPVQLWRSDRDTRTEEHTRLGQGNCHILGGVWQDSRVRTIKIGLPILSRYTTWFQPLHNHLAKVSGEG